MNMLPFYLTLAGGLTTCITAHLHAKATKILSIIVMLITFYSEASLEQENIFMLLATGTAIFILACNELKALYYCLMLFTLLGTHLVIYCDNYVRFILGMEIVTLCTYLMIYQDSSKHALQLTINYFIQSCFISAGFIFMVALEYFNKANFLISNPSVLMQIAVVFFSMFKLGLVPFQQWSLALYHNLKFNNLLTVAVLPKIAVLGFIAKFSFNVVVADAALIILLCGALYAAFTVIALAKVGMIMGFSGIMHFSFMLAFVMLGNVVMLQYYYFVYAICTVVIFSLLYALKLTDYSLASLAFSSKSPFLIAGLTISLLTIAGIPPLLGFYAKAYLLYELLNQHVYIGAGIFVLCLLIGIYYTIKLLTHIIILPNERSYAGNQIKEAIILGSLCIAHLMVAVFCMWPEVFGF